jgi:hypothetical protein
MNRHFWRTKKRYNSETHGAAAGAAAGKHCTQVNECECDVRRREFYLLVCHLGVLVVTVKRRVMIGAGLKAGKINEERPSCAEQK